ncbi:hypothetical protein V8C86DRAFT_522050 [Haematococcus lacustris]
MAPWYGTCGMAPSGLPAPAIAASQERDPTHLHQAGWLAAHQHRLVGAGGAPQVQPWGRGFEAFSGSLQAAHRQPLVTGTAPPHPAESVSLSQGLTSMASHAGGVTPRSCSSGCSQCHSLGLRSSHSGHGLISPAPVPPDAPHVTPCHTVTLRSWSHKPCPSRASSAAAATPNCQGGSLDRARLCGGSCSGPGSRPVPHPLPSPPPSPPSSRHGDQLPPVLPLVKPRWMSSSRQSPHRCPHCSPHCCPLLLPSLLPTSTCLTRRAQAGAAGCLVEGYAARPANPAGQSGVLGCMPLSCPTNPLRLGAAGWWLVWPPAPPTQGLPTEGLLG